jgi:DNA-binding MltR family transcriptional regulator
MRNEAINTAQHWIEHFVNEFSRESDRASVILAVAMLDQSLESLLRGYLVVTNSSEDKLIDGAYAPLASFSARIDIAYRIGLISARLCRDLHIIRRIRNEFAHNVSDCTFASSVVRNRIVELMRTSRFVKERPELRNRFVDGPKGDFQLTVPWMLYFLWDMAESVQPIKPRRLEEFYSDYNDESSSN